ncbi:hypothetical protein TrLO_g15289 [Triparma laevis f. longispina]|uniref:Uncharacterized protein n=1 Tax=Triparma laevis f. longispina TaxID=1714387 RepID=A0A9W7FD24_9STRA|nr:hypothetical protein TrLO_g15289 [Triparma laevis f. longispina]
MQSTYDSAHNPDVGLLQQKQNQISRLEGMLAAQTDEHIAAQGKIRHEAEQKAKKVVKKAVKRQESHNSKLHKKIDKLQIKQQSSADRAMKAEQQAVQLAKRFSESQHELSLAKMRVAELSQELKSAKDLNLSTLEQQHGVSSTSHSSRESDTHSVLANEIRNLRQQVVDLKAEKKGERDRAHTLEVESEGRSSRLLDLQESLTEAANENAKLSRSLEQDRLLMADIKRSNEDINKSMQTSGSKYEQFMKEKKMELKEKDEANAEIREELERIKKSLSVNIMKSVASLREARTKFKTISTMKTTVANSNLAKIKAEAEAAAASAEAVDKKFKSEYVELNSQLSTEKEKVSKLEASATKAEILRQSLEINIETLENKLSNLLADQEVLKASVARIPPAPLLEEGGTQTTPKFAPLPAPTLTIETQTSPRKTADSGTTVSPKAKKTPTKEEEEEEEEEEEYGEDFEDETTETAPPQPTQQQQQQQQQIPDPRISTVISSSDAIASTVISLRSTLQSQDETLEEMKSEIAALRTEKKIAVEQAGLAKLEALELAAKLEVQHTVEEMDNRIENNLRNTTPMAQKSNLLASTAYSTLQAKDEVYHSLLPATNNNEQTANAITQQATAVAANLYEVYRGVKGENDYTGFSATTQAVEYARAKSPEAVLLDSQTSQHRRNQEEFEHEHEHEEQQDLAGSLGSSRNVRFTAPSLQPPQPPTPNFINPETPMRGSPMSALSPEAREVEHMMNEMGPSAPFAVPPSQTNHSPMSQNSYPTYASLGNNNLPRLMHDLRKRVADEVYRVGEALFNVTDSDFRETLRGGRSRNNKPVTDIERYEFKKTLHKTTRGTLRWLLLIYLRTYDSLEDMVGKNKEEVEATRRPPGQFHRSPGESSIPSPSRESTYSNAYMQENLDPDPSDVLRHRMHGLLEDVKLTWEDERRDPEKALAGSLLREQFDDAAGNRSKKQPFHRTEKRRLEHTCHSGCAICGFNKSLDKEQRDNDRRNKLQFLDSGAGPREFWSTVSPSISYHQSQGGEVDEDEVEQHMWRLVLLVRCQDRNRGLRLQRHESQRKLLDLRLYELILLTMRIAFMKEKLVVVEKTRNGGSLKLKFRDIGKWSGRQEGGGGVMGMSGGIAGVSAGSFLKDPAQNEDGQNFARISREFQKMKNDRKMMSMSGKSTSKPTRGSKMRSKAESGPLGSTLVNPMGHSLALGSNMSNAFRGRDFF